MVEHYRVPRDHVACLGIPGDRRPSAASPAVSGSRRDSWLSPFPWRTP